MDKFYHSLQWYESIIAHGLYGVGLFLFVSSVIIMYSFCKNKKHVKAYGFKSTWNKIKQETITINQFQLLFWYSFTFTTSRFVLYLF